MTRYRIVRDVAGNREPHPEQAPDGYDSCLGAQIFCFDKHLDGRWYIEPINADAQPARMDGIA